MQISACVMELVDITDLKSVEPFALAGSSPAAGTNLTLNHKPYYG